MNSRSTVIYASRYDRIPRGVARYGLGEWDRALGNHRAVIRVTAAAEAVYAYLPWRRRDAFPHAKHVMIVDAQSGKAVDNSVVANCNREYGEVVFQPTSGIGLYYAYYLIPTNDRNRWVWPRSSFPITIYESPRTAASPVWRKKFHVSTDDIGSTPDPSKIPWQSSSSYPAPWRDLPEAELVEFQSRGEWHSFYPMEIIATLEETQNLVNRSGARPFILFPEASDHPIRMKKDIPHHWAVRKNEELDQFEATVQKNEYFVFQLGVYAFREMLPNLKVTWSSLQGHSRARIAASAITCFNISGINQHGRPFAKTLHVAQKEVQALWFGVDIPKNAKPGHYEGTVTVASQGVEAQSVVLRLQVVNKMMADRGDGDSNRLSRLRWLNSKHAVDDLVCAPYTPVSVRGRSVHILGRDIELNESGLPERVISFIDMFRIRDSGRDVLSAPVRVDAVRNGKALTWKTARPAKCLRSSSGKAMFKSSQIAPGLKRLTETTIEMDGRIGVRVTLESDKTRTLDGLRLTVKLPANVSRYWLESAPPSWEASGATRLAFACPGSTEKPLSLFQFAWIGDYNAGLAFSIAKSQGGWLHGHKGYFRQRLNSHTCDVELNTGALSLKAGAPMTIEFVLYVTPFKPLPAEHWDWRYCHQGYGHDLDLARGVAAGAKIFIQHQGSPNCPYINYLFPVASALKKIADQVHKTGGLFKAYNTIREQSTRTSELWALRSLGHEILPAGTAGLGFESMAQLPLEYQLRDQVNEPFTGQLWMCEHLVDDYHSRWHSTIAPPNSPMAMEDSSVQISGASRWSNFYIESQRWLMENAGVDGLYLDGVTFDRESFLRVRKTLVRQKPEALIDWHGSPAEIIDFLSFVDSLWFGEGADYSREDAYWLTAVSGIPFGIPGELLQTGASVQRGMVYGISQRYAWMPLDKVDPSPLWKWWDSFDIKTSEMLGYWMADCPVTTNHPAIKATAYLHRGQRLAIAVASWAKEPVAISLKIDWDAVGLDPAKVGVSIPDIPMFQPGQISASLENITIEPDKGWIVVINS